MMGSNGSKSRSHSRRTNRSPDNEPEARPEGEPAHRVERPVYFEARGLEDTPAKRLHRSSHENDSLYCSNPDLSIDEDTESETDDDSSPTNPCHFHISMNSTTTNETRSKVLRLKRFPPTVKYLKRKIESQLKVPVCVQTLLFDSQVVHDHTSLKRLRAQDGDTFTVQYPNAVDIEYFSNLISTLKKIIVMLRMIVNMLNTKHYIDHQTHLIFDRQCNVFINDTVPLKHFSVFPTGIPNANQLYFIDKGGLKLLLKIYFLCHRYLWHKLPYELQQLEYSCLQIIWNFSATLGIRHLIIRENIVNEVFCSLKRTTIGRYKAVTLPGRIADAWTYAHRSVYVLAETIYAAVVVIGNLAEIPECRLRIASAPEVVDHMLGAMMSTTYTYACARSGMCALMCLSFSPETHQYLCTEKTLSSVLELCKKIRNSEDGTSEDERETNKILVQFVAVVLLAHLIHSQWLTKQSEMPETLLSRIRNFMSNYLNNVSHTTINEKMQDKRYYWSTFIPFLHLIYLPQAHTHQESDLIEELNNLCIRTGLVCMQYVCLAENANSVIEHEGLADFIHCAPWLMPSPTLRSSACDMVQLARDKIAIQPPSLMNMIKAQHAAYCCGLQSTLNSNAYTLILNCNSYTKME